MTPRSWPSSPTILFACELGEGFGHVQKLLPLARALARHGYRPVFAVQDVVRPWPLLADTGFPVLQEPRANVSPRADAPAGYSAASYADILTFLGYDDVETLFPVVRAWDNLLDLIRPALVVLDHSPTACLASYGDVPTVLVGTGFTLPPAEGPAFPALLAGKAPLASDERLLQVVQAVQRRRGFPSPSSLPALLAGEGRFVCVLPEIDPYSPTRREPCVGPPAVATPLPATPTTGFFAYLSADYGPVEQVIAALAQSGQPGTAYVRGASAERKGRLRALGVPILDEPRPLASVSATASVLVHHGGCGTAQFALTAGRPQLLFPRNLEQTLTASALHRLGVAHFLRNEYPARDVAEGLRQLAHEPGFRARARAVAEDVQRRGPWNALPQMTDRCLSLLERH